MTEMHKTLHAEFSRLFNLLTETDPRGAGYGTLLLNFERLDSIGPTINEFLCLVPQNYNAPQEMCNEDCTDCYNCASSEAETEHESKEAEAEDKVVEFPTPVPEPHPTETEVEQTDEKPSLTQAEVRSKLAEARRNGVNVAALIKEFGVDNFSALPATRYSDLLDRLDNAGME